MRIPARDYIDPTAEEENEEAIRAAEIVLLEQRERVDDWAAGLHLDWKVVTFLKAPRRAKRVLLPRRFRR